jgi:PEP-CTERM motif
MKALFLLCFASALFGLPSDTIVTPEPGTVLLLAAGLAGVGIASWRRSRSR